MSCDNKRVQVGARHGDKIATTSSVMVKKRTGNLPVPFAEVSTIESIATGFRQQMFDLGDGEVSGSVSTGSGYGSDFITLNWRDKTAVVRGLDLLRVWVETFAPEDAKLFPDGLS